MEGGELRFWMGAVREFNEAVHEMTENEIKKARAAAGQG